MNRESATIGCYKWATSGSARRRQLIYGIIRQTSLERGRRREEKFDEAAELLKERGFILHHYPASHRADQVEKIDHFILSNEGAWFYFQIKGTERAAREFLDSYRGGRQIIVFVLQGHETAEEVADYILEALRGLDSIIVVR